MGACLRVLVRLCVVCLCVIVLECWCVGVMVCLVVWCDWFVVLCLEVRVCEFVRFCG